MSDKIVMRHVRVALQVIGLWPGYTSSVGFVIAITWLLTCLTFQLWHAAVVFSKLDALMGNLGATMAVATATLKLIAFHVKGRNVKIVIKEILNDWAYENRSSNCEVMVQNTKRAKYLTKWITGAYNATVITYLVNAIIAYCSGITEQRLYVLPSKFPSFCKQSPVFEIVCFFQFSAALISTNVQVLVEGMLTVLVLHAGTKVFLLQKEIQKLSVICQSKTNNKEVISKSTIALINKHLNFIKFVKEVKDIYYFISFVHVFTFTFLHVIVGYMFIDTLERGDRSIKLFLYGLFTTRALASTTIYCIAGEYLMNQSMRIFDELYNSAWYEFDVPNIKAITFMIMKARNATSLTPASFGQLSLFYLTSVIRTSFSILSLTRATR
ncbi:odorant receptor 64 [Nasonia vitripennis]|uniref:Odorant receptor n=1 Tax=Nasonia vitripennis TaxID=7425 RepID=A0A7M6UVT6_NASVI|nr:odorant receptor 64 [Nasonia vitripennis]